MISERIRGYISATELTEEEKAELDEWMIDCDEFDFEEYLELVGQRLMIEVTAEELELENEDDAY